MSSALHTKWPEQVPRKLLQLGLAEEKIGDREERREEGEEEGEQREEEGGERGGRKDQKKKRKFHYLKGKHKVCCVIRIKLFGEGPTT